MSPAHDTASLLRQSRERFYPSLTNPNWMVLRARRRIFAKWIPQIPGKALQILDVGGRLQPYRPLFSDRLGKYNAADLTPRGLTDVAASAERLPFASNSFDVVVCTQVLEYVPHPQQAIDEMRRVLKPGGSLLLSVPSVFPRDSDPEYWRFLPSALRMMLQGFTQIEIAAEGSSVAGLFRTLNVWTFAFSPAWFKPVLRWSCVPFLNLVGHLAEKAIRSKNEDFSANFSVWARK